MAAISRREFFKKTATDAAVAGFLAAAAGATLKANPLGLPIGSQTYPHRTMIKDGNFAGLLKELKDIGVERIELCSAIGYAEFAGLGRREGGEEGHCRSRHEMRERALQHA